MTSKYVYNEKYGITICSENGDNVHEVDSDSRVYLDYLDWINKPENVMDIVERIVPESITPVQLRKLLNLMNLRDTVETIIKSMGKDTQDIWEYSEQVQRNNPLVIAMGKQLGIDLDSMFITAATL